MKKTHVLLLVLVAAALCIIVSMFGSFKTYETFATAAKQPDKQFQVIGVLDKDKPTEYDAVNDPDHFTFYVKDEAGAVNKVVYSGAKPTDIEKSQQVVMTGHMDGDAFRCSKVQMNGHFPASK